METLARYTRSRDGTRIAYAVQGTGPDLVLLSAASLSHIDLYPRVAGAQAYLDEIGRGRRLIRVDFRGYGMSERSVENHSPEAFTDDLEAVLDEVGVSRCVLVAAGARVTPALGLVTRRPELVERLVLGDPFTVRPPGTTNTAPPGLNSLMETNWDLFLEVTVNRNAGRPIGYVHEVLAFVRRCMDQRNCVGEARSRRPEEDWAKAAAIDIPVLVLEFTDNIHVVPDLVEQFASCFPRGQFIRLPEGALPPPYGDPEPYLQAVNEFLGPVPSVGPAATDLLTAREREVLAMLVAGSTKGEIAEALVISPATAARHISNLYEKIGAHRRADAVAWAFRHGMD